MRQVHIDSDVHLRVQFCMVFSLPKSFLHFLRPRFPWNCLAIDFLCISIQLRIFVCGAIQNKQSIFSFIHNLRSKWLVCCGVYFAVVASYFSTFQSNFLTHIRCEKSKMKRKKIHALIKKWFVPFIGWIGTHVTPSFSFSHFLTACVAHKSWVLNGYRENIYNMKSAYADRLHKVR